MSFKYAVGLWIAVASVTPAGAATIEGGVSQAELELHDASARRQELERERQERQGERQERESERQERAAERQQRQAERLNDLYDSGMDAAYDGRYDRALKVFTQLAAEKGPRTDAALYWKAYSEHKLGRRPDALATVAQLTNGFPDSRYLKDARALELEIRNAGGQAVAPASQEDEDLKLLAITSLQHSEPEQAVPLLEQVIQGTASPRVKARALYVLALSDSARAREVLTGVAKGGATPELQRRAIQYLGVHGGPESRAALAEVYAASTDVDVKRRILRAFMVAGEKDRLLTAARSEQNHELRSTAVEQLGIMGAHDALWELYQKEANVEVKRDILRAMFVGGNATRLIEIARTEKNPELRLTAVRNLGIMGAPQTGDALLQMYAAETDPDVKKAVIQALFVQGNAAGLVSLARKERDLSMKKTLVQRLSLMDDKVAHDYMVEILKGGA